MSKLCKMSHLPILNVILVFLLISVTAMFIVRGGNASTWFKINKETFFEDNSPNNLTGTTESEKMYATENITTSSLVPGQLTVVGKNNSLDESWLPHANGNSYIRPGKTPQGKNGDVYIGETNTRGNRIGTGDSVQFNQVGPQSWFPYLDGNTYIRPGDNGKEVRLGDWYTGGTRIGTGGDVKFNQIGPQSWFPYLDGNTYIRPGQNGKEVRLGDWFTGGTRLGTGGDVKFNQIGQASWFPYVDGNTYIRPGQDGKSILIGDEWADNVVIGKTDKTNIKLRGKVMFQHGRDDNTDPYSLEKVQDGWNKSELRLTLNDDASESFKIYGDACRQGNCYGEGIMSHKFGVDGTATHTKQVCINNTCLNEQDFQKIKGTA